MNCQEVIERSKTVFASNPIVDTEPLHFVSPRYGPIEFQKFAAQITDHKGNPIAWSVNLNISHAEKHDQLWDDLKECVEVANNWARYAPSYDELLLPFDDYNELVDLVISQVGDAACCVDLGAGTGNAAIRLLESDPEREVWAVDNSENMLEIMRSKVRERRKKGHDYSDRLVYVKDDVARLAALRDDEYFDAAISINTLYAVSDPQECVRQVYRILKPGGVFVMSTAHKKTDVPRLFDRMREVLKEKELFESLRGNYNTAKAFHKQALPMIHRDSKEDIRRYLSEAGFEVRDRDWRDREYVDSVVVVRARKPSQDSTW